MKRIVFKASLGLDGKEVVVGWYDMGDDEWEEELDGRDEREWLQNTGADWAYEAVHTDCLNCWSELEDR